MIVGYACDFKAKVKAALECVRA